MFYLLVISLFLIFALILFLLVYFVFGFLHIRARKRKGPFPLRLKRALQFLEAEGSVTLDEYSEYFGLSEEASFKDLEILKSLGQAEKVGKEENIYYHFIKRPA